MEALIYTFKALSTKLDALERKITKPKLQIDNPLHFPTTIKLEIPRFNGEDPLGWIFKVKQFFIIIVPQMNNDCESSPFTRREKP